MRALLPDVIDWQPMCFRAMRCVLGWLSVFIFVPIDAGIAVVTASIGGVRARIRPSVGSCRSSVKRMWCFAMRDGA